MLGNNRNARLLQAHDLRLNECLEIGLRALRFKLDALLHTRFQCMPGRPSAVAPFTQVPKGTQTRDQNDGDTSK